MSAGQEQQLEHRAREAVARCLIRQLTVPKVYFDAKWPPDGTHQVDVLAVDRAGTGDLHVVEVKFSANVAFAAIAELLPVPAQFRWIAFFRATADSQTELNLIGKQPLYPPNGMGRVGVIEVVQMANDDLGANVRIRAERFMGSFRTQVEQFVTSVPADIQFD